MHKASFHNEVQSNSEITYCNESFCISNHEVLVELKKVEVVKGMVGTE